MFFVPVYGITILFNTEDKFILWPVKFVILN